MDALFQEEAYVEFLRLRRVPLEEKTFSDDASDVVPQVSTVSQASFLSYTFSC